MKLGVVANPRYGDLPSVLTRLDRLASSHGFTLHSEESIRSLWGRDIPALDEGDLNALITLGGDGTLLRGSRLLEGWEIPILGVNVGRLGFLTTVRLSELEEALEALRSGAYSVERRMMLSGSIVGQDGAGRGQHVALNDIAIHKSGVARVIRLRVWIEEEEIGPISGDGLVIATPTGSTAYSLSAGGPIMVPGVEAMVVTPICAHTMAVRPLVIGGGSTINIEPVAPWTDQLMVSFDGQVSVDLHQGDRLCVRRATSSVGLIRLPNDGFLARLRRKLHWGDLMERDDDS